MTGELMTIGASEVARLDLGPPAGLVVSPVAATAQRFRVAGMPGVFVVVVTLPTGESLRWAEFEGKAAGVQRMAL